MHASAEPQSQIITTYLHFSIHPLIYLFYKIVEFTNKELAVVTESWLSPSRSIAYWPRDTDHLTYTKILRIRLDPDINLETISYIHDSLRNRKY
ncbi:unnamed protein product [Callosobruchus maculatus]|uniref:Uncharacterized protein n=1 Tax=Callosobruchus maculatus TaxID=64391 RepID=A0A653DVG7_CALMS|nr:unnamed protein product [Callosobruchus maculatus]VEN57490.1 unnamed protein product [Callosobruchus maculatus]VEN64097.1 unnamed protein product [Callosobruchus maculatus]